MGLKLIRLWIPCLDKFETGSGSGLGGDVGQLLLEGDDLDKLFFQLHLFLVIDSQQVCGGVAGMFNFECIEKYLTFISCQHTCEIVEPLQAEPTVVVAAITGHTTWLR